jgi:ribose-phosphate pyrophosphokinase
MIVIDSDKYKDSGIEVMTFPGGEPHAKLPKFKDLDILLHLKLRRWIDVGYAICVLDALNNQGLDVQIFCPYFPGARQDKTYGGTAPYTVRIIAEMFKDYGVDVFDIHSPVGQTLVARRNFMPSDIKIPMRKDVVGIIAPDEGARKRAANFRDHFYPDADIVQCGKERDPVSGELSNYRIDQPLTKKGRYIIVDDICDGGGTFNLLSSAFHKEKIGAVSPLELFVSHGIFSKGLPAIDYRIEHITTTDSWCVDDSPASKHRLTIIPLLTNLETRFHD